MPAPGLPAPPPARPLTTALGRAPLRPWAAAPHARTTQSVFPRQNVLLDTKIKTVTQALEVAVIERAGSELDSEPDLAICWGCFVLTKTYEHEQSKVVKHW